jgi:hypothetical protein
VALIPRLLHRRRLVIGFQASKVKKHVSSCMDLDQLLHLEPLTHLVQEPTVLVLERQ